MIRIEGSRSWGSARINDRGYSVRRTQRFKHSLGMANYAAKNEGEQHKEVETDGEKEKRPGFMIPTAIVRRGHRNLA